MLRTCVLCCAVAGLVGLTVGCTKTETNGTSTTAKRDEAAKALKEKADKAAGEEKVKLEAKLKEATAKREAVGKKLNEMKNTAADKWEAVKKDVDQALTDLNKTIE